MLIILLWLKKIETNLKAPSFNITNYNSFLVKVTPQICLEKYFSNSVLKTNPCTFKIKDVTVKKIVGSFYRKELLRSTLWICYYSETNSHIRDKVKVVLELSNYATKKELDHATGADTSDLAAEKDLLFWNMKLIN